MTSRQRLLAILRHQEPDRYAWAPLIDDYFMQGLPSEQAKAGIPTFLRSIGADLLLRHVPCYQTHPDGATVTETKSGATTGRTIQTPLGTVTETSERHPGAETSYVTEFAIKSPEDYERVCYWLSHQTLTPDYEATQQVIDEVGDDGLATVDAGAPPLTAFFRFLPQERVLYEFYDHPERLDRLAEAVHKFTFAQCKLAAASPAEVVIAYSADITTRLVSPKMYERYALPFLRECARELHAAGKLFALHLCGDVRALLPLIRASEVDAIDSLSEPPLGNTPFEIAMKELGDGVCLIGGVSPVVLANGKPEEVRAHVLDLFRRMPSRRNLLLCTSDATAFGTPVENLRLVSELVKELGMNFNRNGYATG